MSGFFGSSTRGFLVSLSAINAADALYSILSIYTIHNPRSGVGVLISRIMNVDYNTVLLFIGVACVSASIGAIVHLEIGKRAARYMNLIDYRLLSAAVLALVIGLVYYFTGLFGLAIALVSTAIGLLPVLTGVSRTHLMGVLIIPTAMYFVGVV